MTKHQLFNNIVKKQSFLCIGLDTDIKKIPVHLLKEEDPVFSFNKTVIDVTQQYCVAYKPNTAFYEATGISGLISLKKTVKYIRKNYPEQFIIADAKRGDIGNTSKMYARSVFDHADTDYDAITINPYMGEDSIRPFLVYPNKWVILLVLTSNKGSHDFQLATCSTGEYLFEKVLQKSQTWATDEQMMYVIGATQVKMLTNIRKTIPNHFLLVPGIGTQGGDLKNVAKYGINSHCGLLVNSSRQIIYADFSKKFAEAASQEAQKIQSEMAKYLARYIHLE
ncbi:MAG: orotidine-5'-phosphate decarboxylase [Bacteroidales bacterium OttesenSCG-928-I14]|jgi:orotidine-5'-phosphate decarboxylase|nr:orotidine-5'-phosphate decarboxylase [Bacteroidales bacterium OttesenSCG-928-I14]